MTRAWIYDVRMAQFVLKIEKLSHIMGPRASQDLRSPSPIMAPGFTLFFSERRAKQRRNDEEMLQQELCNLQRKIGLDPTEENVSKFYNVKFKLNQVSLLKTKGAMIRSKARWWEQGERNSKYFYRLERRNHSANETLR